MHYERGYGKASRMKQHLKWVFTFGEELKRYFMLKGQPEGWRGKKWVQGMACYSWTEVFSTGETELDSGAVGPCHLSQNPYSSGQQPLATCAVEHLKWGWSELRFAIQVI